MKINLNTRDVLVVLNVIILSALLYNSSAPFATAHQFQTSASTVSSSFNGKKTSSGQRYNSKAMTAASRTLPLGSKATVTNANTGKTATVTINDRGPFGTSGRGLDVSKAAANRLGAKGPVKVKVTPITGSAPRKKVH
jgi:rare lipoprotein A